MRIRRSPFVVVQPFEELGFDPEAFLEGRLETRKASRYRLVSPISGQRVILNATELATLLAVPVEWMGLEDPRPGKPASLSFDTLAPLMREGLVLSDSQEEPFASLLEAHDALEQRHWNPITLFYQRNNSEEESLIAEDAPREDLIEKVDSAAEDAARFLDQRGRPPATFHSRVDHPEIELPEVESPAVDFFATLEKRRTVRTFDRSRALAQSDLSTLLKFSFGCFGIHRVGEDFSAQHKVSPSGGGLHPIEAFPIVIEAEGLEPGIYHYCTRRHSLTKLQTMERQAMSAELTRLAQGQAFVAGAHVVVALVARVDRNYWKYGERINTFNVIMQDAGHLSQTFYLTAEALGLGAFYTGAIHPAGLSELLGLDWRSEVPVGLSGCGIPLAEDPTWLPIVAPGPSDH